MDQDQMNQPPQAPASMPAKPKSSQPIGPTVGIVIIVIILILGGLYLWGGKLLENGYQSGSDALYPAVETQDQQTANLETQGVSDSASDIEADLEVTDLDNLDAGLDDSAL